MTEISKRWLEDCKNRWLEAKLIYYKVSKLSENMFFGENRDEILKEKKEIRDRHKKNVKEAFKRNVGDEYPMDKNLAHDLMMRMGDLGPHIDEWVRLKSENDGDRPPALQSHVDEYLRLLEKCNKIKKNVDLDMEIRWREWYKNALKEEKERRRQKKKREESEDEKDQEETDDKKEESEDESEEESEDDEDLKTLTKEYNDLTLREKMDINLMWANPRQHDDDYDA